MSRMKDAAEGRQKTLSEAAQARAEHGRSALQSASEDLALISGGAADGTYWAESVTDYESLIEKSQVLFATFDANAVEKSCTKVRRAMDAYRKDAVDARLEEKEVCTALEAAEKLVAKSIATLKEAQFMAAVLTGGKLGVEQCRAALASMVNEKVPTTAVHPVLFAEVQGLMKPGGNGSSSSSGPKADSA